MLPGFSEEDCERLLQMDLGMGQDDWKPTPHGQLLARGLAENDFVSERRVLELGGGVGNHTIVLARRGPSHLTTTEILPHLLETTQRNVERNVPAADFIEYKVADWLNVEGTFDVLVANPPFAKSGKQNRRYFIDSLILDSHRCLAGPGSSIVFVQSSMADLGKTLSRLDENGFDAERVLEHRGPFRDYYFDDPTFMDEIKRVPGGYSEENGTFIETLTVIRAVLRDFSPPEFAHLPEAR